MAGDGLPIASKLLNSLRNVGELGVSKPPHFIRQRCGQPGRKTRLTKKNDGQIIQTRTD